MRRFGWLATALACVALQAAPAAAQQTAAEAERAWQAGDRPRAERLYRALLEADSTHEAALHRTALLLAWRQQYGESLALLDRLLRHYPHNLDGRADRARVLAWRGDTRAARAAVDSILAIAPQHSGARQTRAQLLAWAGEYAAAVQAYEALHAEYPADVDVMLGLAQVLRWQGRNRSALPLLERARGLAPARADVQEQLALVRAALATRATMTGVLEQDSEENDVATLSATATTPLGARSTLRLDAYTRRAENPVEARRAYFASGGVAHQLTVGWTVRGGLGVSIAEGDVGPFLLPSLGLSSPGDRTLTATLAYGRTPLEVTPLLVRNAAFTDALTAELRTRVAGFDAEAGGAVARFDSRATGETSRRTSAHASLTRRVRQVYTLGVRARAFGFDENTAAGWFDPRLYAVAELSARYQRETERWNASLEVAPGWQTLDTFEAAAATSASWRGSARLARVLGPGRELGITLAAARSRQQQLAATAAGDYDYRAFGLTGSWTF